MLNKDPFFKTVVMKHFCGLSSLEQYLQWKLSKCWQFFSEMKFGAPTTVLRHCLSDNLENICFLHFVSVFMKKNGTLETETRHQPKLRENRELNQLIQIHLIVIYCVIKRNEKTSWHLMKVQYWLWSGIIYYLLLIKNAHACTRNNNFLQTIWHGLKNLFLFGGVE